MGTAERHFRGGILAKMVLVSFWFDSKLYFALLTIEAKPMLKSTISNYIIWAVFRIQKVLHEWLEGWVVFRQHNAKPHTVKITSQKMDGGTWLGENSSFPLYTRPCFSDCNWFPSLQNHLEALISKELRKCRLSEFSSKLKKIFSKGITNRRKTS